jgi:hypothetical protein
LPCHEVQQALLGSCIGTGQFDKPGGFDRPGADGVDADMAAFRSRIQLRAKLRTAALVAE